MSFYEYTILLIIMLRDVFGFENRSYVKSSFVSFADVHLSIYLYLLLMFTFLEVLNVVAVFTVKKKISFCDNLIRVSVHGRAV